MKKAFLPLFVLIMAAAVMAANSPSNIFSVSPDLLNVSWLNVSGKADLAAGIFAENMTVTSFSTGTYYVDISNASSLVKNNTFSPARFYVGNGTSDNNTLISIPRNITLYFSTAALAPGRYSGNVTILNSTNTSENANITVTLDVPITISIANKNGTFSGNATDIAKWNGFTELWFFNASRVQNAVGVRINLTNFNPTNGAVTIALYNSTNIASNYLQGTSVLTNVSNSTTSAFTTLYPLSGFWTMGALSNIAAGTTFNGIVELLQGSLRVNNSFDVSTITFTENLGVNSTLSTIFNVSNPSDSALNNLNITNSSSNLTLGGSYIPFLYNFSDTSISATTTKVTQLNVTIDTNKTANQAGVYTGWLLFNSTNGYPNSALNLALQVNLTPYLIVTVNNVTNATDLALSTVPGANVTLNVTPKYQNGTFVPNLGFGNFSVSATHTNNSEFYSITYNGNFPMEVRNVSAASGYYLVNATLNSTALGGNYTFTVTAYDNNTGLNYGSGTSGNVTVSETAIKLDPDIAGHAFCYVTATHTPSLGTVANCTYRVTNYGSVQATNVNVTRSYGTCLDPKDTVNSIINIGTLPAYGGTNVTGNSSYNWRFNVTGTTSCTLTITVQWTGGTKSARYQFVSTINASSSTTTPPGNDEQGSLSIPSQPSTTKAMLVTDWPREVRVIQGGTNTSRVTVKNTGNIKLSQVEMKVTGIDASWWTPVAKQDINNGTSVTYTIPFKVPASATITRYAIVFNAVSNDTSATASANLYVTPAASAQAEINKTVVNLTDRYDTLLTQLNASIRSGLNVSEAEGLLADAKSMLDQANEAIARGDYYTANQLLGQIDTALDDSEAAMTSSSAQSASLTTGFWLWVGAGTIVLAVAVVIVYFVLPRKGAFTPGAGWKPSSTGAGPSAASKAKHMLEELKEKLKRRPQKQKYVLGG